MTRASGVLFSALVVVLGVVGLIGPTVADSGYISGSVTSANGAVDKGSLKFYASCEDFAAGTPAAGQGAISSWHAKSLTCAGATPITIGGNDSVVLEAFPDNNVSGSVTTSRGPVPPGWAWFYVDCGPQSKHYDIPFSAGTYRGTVPDGTYRVLIRSTVAPDSWHSAVQSCERATPVTVSGITTANLRGLGSQQRVKAPPKSIKRGKKAPLAKTSDLGGTVVWTALTTKTCQVRKYYTLVGKARGKCKGRANATGGFLTRLTKTFTVRVR